MSRRVWSVVVPFSFMMLALPHAGIVGCLDATSATGLFDGGTTPFDGGALPSFDASGTIPGTDAGPPSARLSAAAVDFGLADCGGAAPADQVLLLTNAGGGSLTWTATLGTTTAFTLDGATTGTLPPGAAARITVRASAVPGTAAAGAAAEATLTIETSDAAHPSTTVPVKVTPSGGTLVVSPALIDFGTLPLVKKEADVAVDLTNTGNVAVTVDLAQPVDPQFTFDWTGAPSTLTIPPGGAATGLTARFKPTSTLPSSGAATLSPRTAVCGMSATTIAVTGQGTNGNAGIQPGSLDFGLVGCGARGVAKDVKLTNSGSAAFTFTAALGAASPYTLSATTGTVAAGATTTVTVTPKAIPATSLTTADLYADTLTLTTDVLGDTPHLVPLHQTAKGARLAFNPSTIAFSDVPISKSAANPFVVTNGGNAAASVTLSVDNATFGVTPRVASAVNVGGSLAASASFAPNVVGAASAKISVATADVLCAPLPAALTLTGNGTSGKVAISTSSINFGSVDCGTTAAPQTFTVQNSGTATFNWTAALASGAAYTLSPASGALAASATATVTVTPRAVPGTSALTPDLYADTIHVTTDIPGDGAPHDVAVHETARGAVLSFAPASIAFTGVPVNTTQTSTFNVVNDGNAPASVTLTPAGAAFTLSARTANGIAPGGGVSPIGATFKPTDTAPQTGSVALALAAGTVVCKALPAPLALTGSGTVGVASIGPSSISFGNAGLVDCSTRAAGQNVSITNTGNGAFTWTAALGGTSYTLSKASGTVAGASSDTIVVTPIAIPATSATTTDLYADTLTVSWTTQAGVTTKSTVALHMTARGAVLAWLGATGAPFTGAAFGSVAINASPSQAFTVRNTGNAAASVSFTSTDPVFSLTPQNQPVTTSLPGSVLFAPVSSGAHTSTATLVPAAGTPLCGPVPGAATLTGTGINGVPVIPSTPLDYGAVSCGSGTGATRTVTVRNTGNAPFTITPTLGASALPFTIVSPAAGTTVPASGSVDVVVRAPTLAAPASVTPNAYDGQLVITTAGAQNDAGNPHAIPLRLSAQGSILSWVDAQGQPIADVDFGTVGINPATPPTSGFAVRNTGNLAPTVAFGLAPATAFGVTVGGAVPAGGSLAGTFSFSPPATASYSSQASASVTSATPSCGGSLPTVTLRGAGANGAPGVTPATLTFGTNGLVQCGAGAPGAQRVSIANTGNAPFTWRAALLASALPYSVDVSSGTVAPQSTAVVVVTAPAINAPASIAPNAYDGTLRIITSAVGDTAHDVALKASAAGAILSATVTSPVATNLPDTIDYGPQPARYVAPNPVITLVNKGNLAAASVTLVNGANSGFSFTPAVTAVAAGGSVGITGAFSPADTPSRDTLTFDTGTSAVCDSTLPKTVSLTGSMATGVLDVSVAPPDFGEVCSPFVTINGVKIIGNPAVNTALQQTFAIKNSGTAPVSWKLPNLSSRSGLFGIVNQPKQTLAAGEEIKVVVQPLDVPNPAGAYKDSLDFSTSSGPPLSVTLSAKADGVVFVFVPASAVVPSGQRALDLGVRNDGNVAGEFVLSYPPQPNQTWTFQSSAVASVPAGATQAFTAALARGGGTAPWAITATATTNSKTIAPVCAAMPTLDLSGAP
jgi:hypothetical protein